MDIVEIGDVMVTAVHTPGHTEDHLCYRIADVVFTGSPPTLKVSEEMRVRFFNAYGAPIDGGLDVEGDLREIGGPSANPVRRKQPSELIATGIALAWIYRWRGLPASITAHATVNVVAAIAIVASASLGRFLRASRLHAALLILALGLVLMATLPPTGAAIAGQGSYQDFCDLGRMTPASLPVLLRPNDTSLNVLLFVPLGTALGALARSRQKSILIGVAFLLMPVLIRTWRDFNRKST